MTTRKSPSISPESKKSKNRTKKSQRSPKASTKEELDAREKLKESAFNIFYNENPKSLETFKLFSTTPKYKKQFRRVDETDIKIETLREKINTLEQFVSENNSLKDTIEEQLQPLYIVDESTVVKKQMNKLKNEIKFINDKIKKANGEIEKYELMIENAEFIRKIWDSTKIDDAKKQQLTDEYNSLINIQEHKIENIQRRIELNKKKSYTPSNPVYIDSEEEIPENAVMIGRDLYIINEEATKYMDFIKKREIEFQKNMEKWKMLNDEVRTMKNNISSFL
jgi:hypothetical protein